MQVPVRVIPPPKTRTPFRARLCQDLSWYRIGWLFLGRRLLVRSCPTFSPLTFPPAWTTAHTARSAAVAEWGSTTGTRMPR